MKCPQSVRPKRWPLSSYQYKKNESLLDGMEGKRPRVLQEFLALAGVRNQPRHVKRPGHPRKQKADLAISLLIVRARHVFRRAFRVLDEKVEKCTAYFGGTPADFRGQCRDRTPVRRVVAMLKAQVRVDESLQLTAFRSVLDRRVRVMCQLLQTLLESRNEQLLLAAEAPVKPAVRKAKVAHESSDGRPFRPSASESP